MTRRRHSMSDVEFFGSAAFVGIVIFVLIFLSVILTGQTFGQRCTAADFAESDHRECVTRLTMGGGE